jgi:hypothetical protein
VLAICDDSAKGKRDRALLLFAWANRGNLVFEFGAGGAFHLVVSLLLAVGVVACSVQYGRIDVWL